MQVLFLGMGRCVPTDIRSSPCWNHQSKFVQWSAQQKAKAAITLCSMAWKRVMGTIDFFNPQAPVFSLYLTPLPRGVFLNFLMDCLTSQCICETVPRSDRTSSREENGRFIQGEFCYHFPDTGLQFGCLTYSLNKLGSRNFPGVFRKIVSAPPAVHFRYFLW